MSGYPDAFSAAGPRRKAAVLALIMSANFAAGRQALALAEVKRRINKEDKEK